MGQQGYFVEVGFNSGPTGRVLRVGSRTRTWTPHPGSDTFSGPVTTKVVHSSCRIPRTRKSCRFAKAQRTQLLLGGVRKTMDRPPEILKNSVGDSQEQKRNSWQDSCIRGGGPEKRNEKGMHNLAWLLSCPNQYGSKLLDLKVREHLSVLLALL